jgi:autotransporter-associated beta strand protein
MKKKATLSLITSCSFFLTVGIASGQTSFDWTPGTSIADNNPVGVADTRLITFDPAAVVTGLEVRLNLTGGWNGDMYASLVHDSGFTVLLNRPGNTVSNPGGSGSSGMTVTFSAAATTDIHTGIPNSGTVTGTWQPDARTADPLLVTNSSPRTAFLSSFNEAPVQGNWTLFLADNAAADITTLTGWGLTITSELRDFAIWDSNENGSNVGGNGTWSSTSGTWATSAVGTSTAAQTSTAQLVFQGTAGTVTVSGTVAPQAGMHFKSTGYSLTGGAINLAGATAAANMITTNASVTTTISSSLTGSNGVSKNGSGTLVMAGNNSYNEATNVDAGTLLVNGDNTGTGAVSVDAGATLGGTGSIAGAVNVTGMLSPGASVETFTTGALTFNSGSVFQYEVDSSVALAVGGDLQRVTGNLDLNGNVDLSLGDISLSPVSYANDTVFTLINYLGSWNGGLFRFNGNTISDGDTFFALNTEWRLDYDSTLGGGNFTGEYQPNSSFVNITAVPEPSAALIGGLGMLVLLRRRRN